ncbi:MAG: DEAD/DEAH box helicase family protein [Pseudomonadota bacterium]
MTSQPRSEPASTATPWQAYEAGLTLRGYQQRTLDLFDSRTRAGQRSFYLVAPPGSGKTLLGLLMAQRLGEPAVCVSPNAAIQQQWLSRLTQHWVCVDTEVEKRAPTPPCSSEPTGPLQTLIALTYQRLAVRGEDSERHGNVHELHRRLRQAGVRTVILDECHHLSAEWGQACVELCQALEDPFVIGLTATPVEQDHGPLARLLQKPDHAISLPSVVRHGDLAPFQDLCWIVAPSADEEQDLRGDLGRFEELYRRLRQPAEGRFSLDVWCDGLELEPRRVDGETVTDLSELYAAEPALVTAWCRQRFEGGREPCVDLPYAPEFYESPTLLDRLQLAACYCARHLLGDHPDDRLGREAREILAGWGLAVSEGRVQRRPGKVSRRVLFSRMKLDAMAAILRLEQEALGPDLRVLVLTDHEFPPEDRGGLSCVDAMRLLTADPELDALDPILLTGRSVLVDDDLWPRFEEHFSRACAARGWTVHIEAQAEAGHVRVRGEGRDWNTRAHVELITELLQEGVCRCLVGTRALLGEGWDCQRLNTLIDLTAISSGVSVNQIRGRTLRHDPENPVKVANNWDVLCLSTLGEGADLERLIDKHQHFYGLTDDGVVERGVGHLHAGFDRVSVLELHRDRAQINAAMAQRARARMAARTSWRVGEPFDDRERQVLSFTARTRPAPSPGKELPAPQPPPASASLIALPRERRRDTWETAAFLSSLAAGAGLYAGASAAGLAWVSSAAALLASAPILLTLVWLEARRRRRGDDDVLSVDLRSLAGVLAAALPESTGEGAEPQVTRRDDGTVRVQWPGSSDDRSARLTQALAELLGPLTTPRYLIQERLRTTSTRHLLLRLFERQDPISRVYAVPRALAQKSQAELLLRIWKQRRCRDVQLLHTQTPEGQDLLARHRLRRPLDGETTVRAVWN